MKQAITYILNGEKTEEKALTGGWNVQADKAYEQMMDTKEVFGKTGGRQGYHIIISFKEDETDSQTAMKIVEKFVKEYLEDYEAVYAVHDNTDHIHAHVIFNSVSYVTGLKYHYKKNDWASFIQPIVNRICEEYGLSTIELDEEEVHNRYQDWNENRDGKFVWSDMIKRDIDIAIAEAKSYEEFVSIMEKRGYEAKQGKYLAFRAPGMNRFRRCYQMGGEYTEERIRNRIPVETLDNYHIDTFDEVERIVYSKIPKSKRTKLNKLQKKYYSRLYKLGLISRRPYSQAWKYKDDIKMLHQLQEEYNFLVDNDISNVNQVIELEKEARTQKKIIIAEKNRVYRVIKKSKDLFDIADEMNSLSYEEKAYAAGDMEFEEEHIRCQELSNMLKAQGYSYEEVLEIKEHYRLEGIRLRETVRDINKRISIISSLKNNLINDIKLEIDKDVVKEIDKKIDKASTEMQDENYQKSASKKR